MELLGSGRKFSGRSSWGKAFGGVVEAGDLEALWILSEGIPSCLEMSSNGELNGWWDTKELGCGVCGKGAAAAEPERGSVTGALRGVSFAFCDNSFFAHSAKPSGPLVDLLGK